MVNLIYIVLIKMVKTEVNIFTRDSSFQEFIFKENVNLDKTDDNYEFCSGVYGGYECLFEMKKI